MLIDLRCLFAEHYNSLYISLIHFFWYFRSNQKLAKRSFTLYNQLFSECTNIKTKDAIHNYLIGDVDSDDYEDMNQKMTTKNSKSSEGKNPNKVIQRKSTEVVTINDSDQDTSKSESKKENNSTNSETVYKFYNQNGNVHTMMTYADGKWTMTGNLQGINLDIGRRDIGRQDEGRIEELMVNDNNEPTFRRKRRGNQENSEVGPGEVAGHRAKNQRN